MYVNKRANNFAFIYVWRSSLMKFSVCSAATPEQKLNLAAEKRQVFLYLVLLEHHVPHVGSQHCLALSLPPPTHFMLILTLIYAFLNEGVYLCFLSSFSAVGFASEFTPKRNELSSVLIIRSPSLPTRPPAAQWLLVFRSHFLHRSLCSFICSRNCSFSFHFPISVGTIPSITDCPDFKNLHSAHVLKSYVPQSPRVYFSFPPDLCQSHVHPHRH